MAIGDAISGRIGAGSSSRQPASGVEEMITSLNKTGSTDTASLDTGSGTVVIMEAAAIGRSETSTFRSMKTIITNSCWLVKDGSTDSLFFTGVQTNA